MKKIIVILIILTMQSFAVTVDGYAYLEGETDHSGIEVYFQRVAPDTNFNYTVYTDSNGYYTSEVEQGLYDVVYNKSQFYSDSLSTVNLYSSVTLDDMTLLSYGTALTGSISGVISRGEYEVIGNLVVEEGDSLIIQPGTVLLFDPDVQFDVYGYLQAEGAENDSIYFTSSTNWNGIFIRPSADGNTRIGYSVIKNSLDFGISFENNNSIIHNCNIRNNTFVSGYSAGVKISSSNIGTDIENCVFENNNSTAIYIINSTVKISNCDIIGNSGYYAGGIMFNSSDIEMKSCNIRNNVGHESGGIFSAYSNFTIENSDIIGNSGSSGGIRTIYQETSITYIKIINSKISENFASSAGGGISIGYSPSSFLVIENSIVSNNSSNGDAAIHTSMNTYIYNSVISNNVGTGVYTSSSDPLNIYNSMINQNTDYGVYSFISMSHNIVNNCFSSNTPSNFYQCGDYIGVNATTNANGDPCDPWYNISLDPMFVDVENGDFKLQSGSPCVDAGTNTISDYEFPLADLDGNYRIWDGDGNGSNIVDMGAYEYNSPSGIDNEQLTINNYTLLQNYPNPFNPETTISYSLTNNAQVQLRVFDMLGREVANLVDSKQNKGSHQVKFDGSILTSGIYFYQLSVDNKVVESRKMMLLK